MKRLQIKLLVLSIIVAFFSLNSLSIQSSAASVTTIHGFSDPNGLTFDSHNNMMYVTDSSAGNISVVSDSTNTIVKNISIGNYAETIYVIFDRHNFDLYASNLGRGTVSVISDTTNTVIANITGFSEPGAILFDGHNNEIYVADWFANTVTAINDSTNQVIATIPVGINPSQIVFDSHNDRIYVLNYHLGTISVISDSKNKVIRTMSNLPYCCSAAGGMVFDGHSNLIYVAAYDATVVAISPVSNNEVAIITGFIKPGSPNGLVGIAYDSHLHELYVLNTGTDRAYAFSDSTNKIVKTFPVGYYPEQAHFDPHNNRVYVTNLVDGTVSVVPG